MGGRSVAAGGDEAVEFVTREQCVFERRLGRRIDGLRCLINAARSCLMVLAMRMTNCFGGTSREAAYP
jgi:hypothetical protein